MMPHTLTAQPILTAGVQPNAVDRAANPSLAACIECGGSGLLTLRSNKRAFGPPILRMPWSWTPSANTNQRGP